MITVKDVARDAGVSLATVSRVINQAENVSPTIREKVLDSIERLGYIPNSAARSLVRRQTGSIAVLMRNLHSPFFSELIHGFEDGMSREGRTVFFCSLGRDQAIRDQYIQFLINGVADAIILYGSLYTDQPIIERLQTINFPFLLIENNFQHMSVNQFLINNTEGAYQAVTYLMDHGHQRICYFMGDPNKKVNLDRLNGYTRAMQQNGLRIEVDSIRPTFSDPSIAYQLAREMMKEAPEKRPTALFCCSDRIAASAIRGIMDAGYRVPEDISVVGFDDQLIPGDDYSGPRITSVHQPLYEMGVEGAHAIIQLLNQRPERPISRIFSTSLAEHSTVKDLKK